MLKDLFKACGEYPRSLGATFRDWQFKPEGLDARLRGLEGWPRCKRPDPEDGKAWINVGMDGHTDIKNTPLHPKGRCLLGPLLSKRQERHKVY